MCSTFLFENSSLISSSKFETNSLVSIIVISDSSNCREQFSFDCPTKYLLIPLVSVRFIQRLSLQKNCILRSLRKFKIRLAAVVAISDTSKKRFLFSICPTKHGFILLDANTCPYLRMLHFAFSIRNIWNKFIVCAYVLINSIEWINFVTRIFARPSFIVHQSPSWYELLGNLYT